MKEALIIGGVLGAYTFLRDYLKVQNATLYKYPYLIDAGAIAGGWFLRKYNRTLGDALMVSGMGNAVKDVMFTFLRSSQSTTQAQ
jgi:hypothetical protein